MAATDYALLQSFGLGTVRDGARWHLIEKRRGIYDWSSFASMLGAAPSTHMQVIWDVLHFGWPDWLDIWSADFIERFAAFAKALAIHVMDRNDDIP